MSCRICSGRAKAWFVVVWIFVTCGVARGPLASAQQAMVPMPIDWENHDASAIDLSGFLQAPAGRDGFVKVDGSHIIRPDGSRFRVWGVNLTGEHCFPEKQAAERLASDLARLGINAVRLHGLDAHWGGRNIFVQGANDTRTLDPESLDRLDYLVSSLKKHGIYTNLNLNVFRHYRPGDDVRDAVLLGMGKSATFFNDRLVALQKEYARQLLTHRNAYTDNDYRHEPAVICVELVNENSVLEGWAGWRLMGRDDPAADGTWRPIPTSYASELTDRYNDWLLANVSDEALAAIREEAGAAPDGRVPRLQPDQFVAASSPRFRAETRFYVEIERGFFEEMRRFLSDDLGVKPIVLGTADHNDGISGYAHIWSNMTFPLIDGHGYWQHPDLKAGTKIQNTPMVDDPLDSTVVQFARTPVVGRPFWISEVNHPFPHEFACEGIPILTAYALLHDWDGVWWYTWGGGRKVGPQHGIPRNGWFDMSADPVKVASLAACGYLWHRGDVAPAKRTVVRSYTLDEMLESLRMDRNERPFFTPGFARSTPLEHATRWAPADASVKSEPFPPAAHLGEIVSDTGEITWRGADAKRGVVVVSTSRSEAAVGHLGAGSGSSLVHLGIELENPFAAVVLTSMDGKPIVQSGKLLLLTGSRVANTEQAWEQDHKTLADWGHGPVQVEAVRGTITLEGIEGVKKVRISRLSPVGKPEGEALEAKEKDGAWTWRVGEPPAVWWRIDVAR